MSLSWDRSTDPAVTGYKVYYGVSSRAYTNVVSAQNATSVTVPGLTLGVTYYFAATGVTASGVESSFSGEVAYVPTAGRPPAGTKISAKLGANRQMTLSATANAGTVFDVLASQNMTTWTKIGSVTANSNGVVQFVDPTAATGTMRVYRLRQTSP